MEKHVDGVATRTINGLALCAGVGTIELGLRLVLGSRYRTVGYVERETFATSVLVARMADKALDTAPVWDDLATFDGGPWRGRVDIVTAGFPCQPFSQAGRRGGTSDKRWLWPDVHRIVDEARPSLVFLENVPPIVKHGLDEILEGLTASGFDAEWGCLSAADVGATHLRKRLWLLAYSDSARLPVVRFPAEQQRRFADRPGRADVVADPGGERRQPLTGSEPAAQSGATRRTPHTGHVADRARQDVADPESVDRRTRPDETDPGTESGRVDRGEPSDRRNHQLADTERTGPQGCVHRLPERQRRPAVRGDQMGTDLPLWPPRPEDELGWSANADGPQPSVCRTSDGLASRLDRLHAIGNGVVPLVAATAFIRLAQRAGLTDETR